MGKVCSKAHGLRYVEDDYFIGTRLGPEGKCLSSQESISQSSCNEALKLKTEQSNGARSSCQLGCSEAGKEQDKACFIACKPKVIDGCDLIVDLPPESKKAEDKFPSEVEIPVKVEIQDAALKTEDKNHQNGPPKPSRDEWSYTVYDIDGGSKVTEQDLSHVMHSIRTAIDQTVDQDAPNTAAKDSKMLKIKVAIGQHENNESKLERKPPRSFNRMLLPPPDSEEAELLCYYIREKLLTFANQEKNSTREPSKERKRSKRGVRDENCLNGRSPEVSPEVERESNRKKLLSSRENPERKQPIATKETSFITSTPPSCSQIRKEYGAPEESSQPQVNRPLYGLPQRQGTYGGPVDSCTESSRFRSRNHCPPSSGTRSPNTFGNEVAPRGLGIDHAVEVADQNLKGVSKLSSFCHKDAYRESREEGSPRKCKMSTGKLKPIHPKVQMPLNGLLHTPVRTGPKERRSETAKICPCKYRGGRASRHKKLRSTSSSDKDHPIDFLASTDDAHTARNMDRKEPSSHDDVFSRDDVISSDGTGSRDEVRLNSELKLERRSREGSRSSGESRSEDGITSLADLRSEETTNRTLEDSLPCYGLQWNEGTALHDTSRDDPSTRREFKQQARNAINKDLSRSCKGSVVVENSSNESSTGASHSSSWKDQLSFGTGNNCYKFVHEWNDDQELTTGNMIQLMQEQDTRTLSGSQSPRSQTLDSPKSEIVHRHEHHHYHYHIFKRS